MISLNLAPGGLLIVVIWTTCHQTLQDSPKHRQKKIFTAGREGLCIFGIGTMEVHPLGLPKECFTCPSIESTSYLPPTSS